MKKLQKDFQDRLADASTTAEENISSIRTVRSFVGEGKAAHNYGQDIDKSYQVGKKLAFIQGRPSLLAQESVFFSFYIPCYDMLHVICKAKKSKVFRFHYQKKTNRVGR